MTEQLQDESRAESVPNEVENQSASMQPPTPQPGGSSAGIIILQWLTYAFWGWTILSLGWLIFIVLANFITGLDVTAIIPYAIAATVVLLPLSIVCDVFYGRREPEHKKGAAMVVMVIHAVIFALFGIGTLISAVLTVVQMAIGSSGDSYDYQIVWLGTSLICALIYGFVFLRTLNPSPKLHLSRLFPIVMAVIVGVFIVLGFIGPIARAGLTRDDRDIVASIDDIQRSVESYISRNNRLPASLSSLSVRPNAKSVIERNLVTFKADGQIATKPGAGESAGLEYRYQLCAVYRQADNSSNSYDDWDYDSTEYKSSVRAYGHPAGNVCYKLKYVIYE